MGDVFHSELVHHILLVISEYIYQIRKTCRIPYKSQHFKKFISIKSVYVIDSHNNLTIALAQNVRYLLLDTECVLLSMV